MTQIENLSRTEDQQYVTAIILIDPLIFYSNYFYLDVLEFNSTKLLNIGTCSLYCVTHVPGNFFLKYWYILSPTLSVSRF